MSRAFDILEAELTPREFLKKHAPRYPHAWPQFKRWRDWDRYGAKFRRGEHRNIRHLYWPAERKYALRYHETDILSYEPDGTVEVNVGRWQTVTTKQHLNSFLPHNWFVYGRNISGWHGFGGGDWHWANYHWPDEMRGKIWTEYKRKHPRWFAIPFGNGDKIKPDGTLEFHGGTAKPDGTIHLDGKDVITPERAIRILTYDPPRRWRRGMRDPNQMLLNLEHLVRLGLLSESYLDRLHWLKRVQRKHELMADAERLKRETDPKAIRKAKPWKYAPERR